MIEIVIVAAIVLFVANFLIGHDYKEGPSGLEFKPKNEKEAVQYWACQWWFKTDIMVKVHDFTARTLGKHINIPIHR